MVNCINLSETSIFFCVGNPSAQRERKFAPKFQMRTYSKRKCFSIGIGKFSIPRLTLPSRIKHTWTQRRDTLDTSDRPVITRRFRATNSHNSVSVIRRCFRDRAMVVNIAIERENNAQQLERGVTNEAIKHERV